MIPVLLRMVAGGATKGAAKSFGKKKANEEIKSTAEERVQQKLENKNSENNNPPQNNSADNTPFGASKSLSQNPKRIKDSLKDIDGLEKNLTEVGKTKSLSSGNTDDKSMKGFISSEFDSLRKSIDNKIDSVIQVTKANLQVNKQSLEEQKDTQEWNEEQEYEREHERKEQQKKGMGTKVVEKVQGAGAAVGNAAGKVKDNGGLLGMLAAAGGLAAMFWPQIKEGISKIGDMIMEYAPKIFHGIVDGLVKFGGQAIDWIATNGPEIIKNIWQGVKSIATMLLEKITKYGPDLLKKAVAGLGELAKFTLDSIIKYGPTLVGMAYDTLKGLGKLVIDTVVEYGPQLLKLAVKGLTKLASDVFDLIKEYGPQAWKKVKEGAVWVFDQVKEKLTQLKDWIFDGISDMWDGIQDWIYKKTNGMFGTERLDDKQKAEFKNKVENTKFSRDSDDFRDQMIKLKVVNPNLVTKDEIESEARLKELPLDVLKRLYASDWLSEDAKKMIKGYVDKLEAPILKAKQQEQAAREAYKNSDSGRLDNVNIQIEAERNRGTRFSNLNEEGKLTGAGYEMAMKGHDDRLDALLKMQRDLQQKIEAQNIGQGEAANISNPKQETRIIQYSIADGDGDPSEEAGIVHRGEYVINPDLLKEIEAAKTEDEKNKLIQKANDGKSQEYKDALQNLLWRGKPSGHTVNIMGLEVQLTNAQYEEYEKIETNGRMDEYDKIAAQEQLLDDITADKWEDKGAVYKVSKPQAEAGTSPFKGGMTEGVVADTNVVSGSAGKYKLEPMKVHPDVPTVKAEEEDPSKIKPEDVFRFNGSSAKSGFKDLNPDVQHNLIGMGQEYKETYDEPLQLNSTGRSVKEQLKLYNDMLKRNGGRSDGSVATPGGSMHNYGLAVDSQSNQLNIAEKSGLMGKWGFHRNVYKKDGKLETWHMEPVGISSKDRQNIRNAGKAALKKGLDVDKMVQSGQFTKGKIQKLGADGQPLNELQEEQESTAATNVEVDGAAASRNEMAAMITQPVNPDVPNVSAEDTEKERLEYLAKKWDLNTAAGRAGFEREAKGEKLSLVDEANMSSLQAVQGLMGKLGFEGDSITSLGEASQVSEMSLSERLTRTGTNAKESMAQLSGDTKVKPEETKPQPSIGSKPEQTAVQMIKPEKDPIADKFGWDTTTAAGKEGWRKEQEKAAEFGIRLYTPEGQEAWEKERDEHGMGMVDQADHSSLQAVQGLMGKLGLDGDEIVNLGEASKVSEMSFADRVARTGANAKESMAQLSGDTLGAVTSMIPGVSSKTAANIAQSTKDGVKAGADWAGDKLKQGGTAVASGAKSIWGKITGKGKEEEGGPADLVNDNKTAPEVQKEGTAYEISKESANVELKDNSNNGESLKTQDVQASQKRDRNVPLDQKGKQMAQQTAQTVKAPEPVIVEKTNTVVHTQPEKPAEIDLKSSRLHDGGFMLLGNTI